MNNGISIKIGEIKLGEKMSLETNTIRSAEFCLDDEYSNISGIKIKFE